MQSQCIILLAPLPPPISTTKNSKKDQKIKVPLLISAMMLPMPTYPSLLIPSYPNPTAMPPSHHITIIIFHPPPIPSFIPSSRVSHHPSSIKHASNMQKKKANAVGNNNNSSKQRTRIESTQAYKARTHSFLTT